MTNYELKIGTRQKGFTLIEMSIVLVIIGLIIGGILKGQEIIESSRQKSVLTQVDAVRAAMNTFMDRYKELPGDFRFATTRINADASAFANGDGNGIVGTGVSTAATIASDQVNLVENTQFFTHMVGAKLINGTPQLAANATAFGENSPLPSTAFPGAGMGVTYGTYNENPNTARVAHWLKIVRGTPAAPAAGVSPKQAYAIDAKIDDALPYGGLVRTGLNTANCGTATVSYVATNENVECTLLVDISQ